MPLDIRPLMTPERVLGALLWELAHDTLTDEMIDLVREMLYHEAVAAMDPEGDLDCAIGMVRGANTAPHIRPYLIDLVRDEVSQTLRLLANPPADDEQ